LIFALPLASDQATERRLRFSSAASVALGRNNSRSAFTQARASLRVVAAEDQPHGAYEGPEEGVMSYSTKLVWLGGPDHGWWVELLKDGERVAYMSLDEWGSLDATQQAIEDAIADRAAAKANRAADV
jgi:hypothetical protein